MLAGRLFMYAFVMAAPSRRERLVARRRTSGRPITAPGRSSFAVGRMRSPDWLAKGRSGLAPAGMRARGR